MFGKDKKVKSSKSMTKEELAGEIYDLNKAKGYKSSLRRSKAIKIMVNGKQPIIPKKDQDGDAIKKAPKGVDKVVRTRKGSIIMVSSSKDLKDKPVKSAAKPAKAPAEPKKEESMKKQTKAELAGEVYDLLMKKYPNKPKALPSKESFIRSNVNGEAGYKPTSMADLEKYKKELQDELGVARPVKASAALKKTPIQKKPSEPKKPAARTPKERKTAERKAPTKKELKAHDDYENMIMGAAPLPLGLKPKRQTKKELRHVVKGGFTVWDGLQRTGKTFETKQEADDYADDFFKKTGIRVSVMSTSRNVTHTFRSEEQNKKK